MVWFLNGLIRSAGYYLKNMIFQIDGLDHFINELKIYQKDWCSNNNRALISFLLLLKICPKRRRSWGNLKTIVYLQCFLWKWVSHIFRLSLSIRPDNRAWGKCWTWWVSLTLSNFHHFLSKILGIEQHSRVQSWFQEVLPGKPTPANSNFLMPAHKKTTGCERGKWRGSNFFFKLVWSSWSAFYFTLTKVKIFQDSEKDCQSGIFCEFDESLWKKLDGACALLLWYFTQLNCLMMGPLAPSSAAFESKCIIPERKLLLFS